MDFGEFYKWWKDPVTESKLASCKQRMADVKDRFDEVDADGSDALDREEVRTLCEKLLGVPITEAQLDEGMGEMDRDNSGEVDFHEFYGARKLGFESRIRISPRAWKALALSSAGLRCVAGWWDRSSGGLLGEAKKAEERKAAQWKAVKPVEKQVRIHPICGCHTGCKAFGGRGGSGG